MQRIVIDDICWNLNETIHATKRHWGSYYNHKKKWSKKIKTACKNLKPYAGPIRVSIKNVYPTKRRRDPDNIILKFILDGLVEAGIIPDDSFEYIEAIVIEKPEIKKKAKQTIITLEAK